MRNPLTHFADRSDGIGCVIRCSFKIFLSISYILMIFCYWFPYEIDQIDWYRGYWRDIGRRPVFEHRNSRTNQWPAPSQTKFTEHLLLNVMKLPFSETAFCASRPMPSSPVRYYVHRKVQSFIRLHLIWKTHWSSGNSATLVGPNYYGCFCIFVFTSPFGKWEDICLEKCVCFRTQPSEIGNKFQFSLVQFYPLHKLLHGKSRHSLWVHRIKASWS